MAMKTTVAIIVSVMSLMTPSALALESLHWTKGIGGAPDGACLPPTSAPNDPPVCPTATWSARSGHAAVSFDDGVIVTTGGQPSFSGGTVRSLSSAEVHATTSEGTKFLLVTNQPGVNTALQRRELHAIARVPGDGNAFLVVGGRSYRCNPSYSESCSTPGPVEYILNDAQLTKDRGGSFTTVSTSVFTLPASGCGLVGINGMTFIAFGGMPTPCVNLVDTYGEVTGCGSTGTSHSEVYSNEVRKSTNGGATWITIRSDTDDVYNNNGADECPTTSTATSTQSMWRGMQIYGHTYMPFKNRIVVAKATSIWVSDDEGICWTEFSLGNNDLGAAMGHQKQSLVVATINGGEILVLACGASTNAISTSFDGGVTWNRVETASESPLDRSMYPPALARHTTALVFNAKSHSLALFGGDAEYQGIAIKTNDLWTAWGMFAWTQAPTTSPSTSPSSASPTTSPSASPTTSPSASPTAPYAASTATTAQKTDLEQNATLLAVMLIAGATIAIISVIVTVVVVVATTVIVLCARRGNANAAAIVVDNVVPGRVIGDDAPSRAEARAARVAARRLRSDAPAGVVGGSRSIDAATPPRGVDIEMTGRNPAFFRRVPEGPVEGGSEGGSSSEWVQCHSAEHDAHYWKHTLTGEKTWVCPPELGEHGICHDFDDHAC